MQKQNKKIIKCISLYKSAHLKFTAMCTSASPPPTQRPQISLYSSEKYQ